MSITSSAVPSQVYVALATRSDVGRVRTNNEDACALIDVASGLSLPSCALVNLESAPVLLALSDGMGGHQAGEVASALVIETLSTRLRADPSETVEHAIEAAVADANARRVHKSSCRDPLLDARRRQ
jgi:serine/threonine protein phosphatase PrpC